MKSVVSSDSVPLPIDTVPQQSFFQGEFQKGHGYLKNCNIEREISKRTKISEKTATKYGNFKKIQGNPQQVFTSNKMEESEFIDLLVK